ncbi:YbhB/YbcL family Raf kinase inhibitor-like protein [Phenylobacterium deserti]|uniref:YbhB/YbcL family Raf kinase inhibitor-like protein n=1 Tax=Phenylobacterium deserti TaxID=1914756 RepID=A0A328AA09_9CAUL|nr:YbhB/YbcL family Raf kinase inhibitor-like protein [Phenylobacterium deserti]RAK51379.1 YbhB/YbcL family Raf kinase inhibitor-like protein [Phenylobacterium deserti]
MSDQEHHPEHSGEAITIMKIQPAYETGVIVTSEVQETDGRLPDRYTGYFDNISPPLHWNSVPDVRAWAVIVEDPDAPQTHPFVHWMVWNIHGEVTSLPEGLPNQEFLATPQGGIQGRNGMGGYGYFGPRPPAGHGVHRYYFQVFALADTIDMGPDTPLPDLVNALKGLTLAKGELMATYEAPESAESDFHYRSEGKGGGKSQAGGALEEDPAGSTVIRGEKASPGDRKRGEISSSDQT